MALPKLKIEFTADGGERISLTVSGRLSKRKISQLLDFLELMFGETEYVKEVTNGSSVFERFIKLIKTRFKDTWFTSRDVVAAYQEMYGEGVRLSTASTYLTRLCESGLLERKGSRSCWSYRMVLSKGFRSEFLVKSLS